jgi:hypothetical protein
MRVGLRIPPACQRYRDRPDEASAANTLISPKRRPSIPCNQKSPSKHELRIAVDAIEAVRPLVWISLLSGAICMAARGTSENHEGWSRLVEMRKLELQNGAMS